MIPYWILFAIPAVAALLEQPTGGGRHKFRTLGFTLVLLFIGLMIGLRYEVGGDWLNYLAYLLSADFAAFSEIWDAGDPGYGLLNWLASRWDGGVWQVNLVCGLIFAAGLFAFCRYQPRPWLALTVAVPYLVIVVAMGYTRQGAAIGLAMIGLVALARRRGPLHFVLWVVLAATFHKSAVLLIPIAALADNRGRWWTAAWVTAAAAAAYFTLLQDSVEGLVTNYIDARYQSDGAAIRVAMNAAPAALFVLFRKRFAMAPQEMRLWLIVSGLALAMVPALIFSPSSTAIDRMALYIIPLQLVVLSRLPEVFGRSGRFLSPAIVLYSGVVQFVWLTFGTYAFAWLPYRLYPIFG